jgi:hypothetical protein
LCWRDLCLLQSPCGIHGARLVGLHDGLAKAMGVAAVGLDCRAVGGRCWPWS